MQLHNTYNYAVIKKLKSMLETSNKELNITSLVGRCQYVLYHQNVGDYCSSDTYWKYIVHCWYINICYYISMYMYM